MEERDFAENYALMLNGELAKVLRSRRTLVPAARAALDKEVAKRGLDPGALRKQRPDYHSEQKHPTELSKRMKSKRLRWQASVALVATSFMLAMALDHFGVLQFIWLIVITIAVPVFTVWGFWELKGQLWFWAAILAITSAHVVFFYFVDWPWGTRHVAAQTIQGICTLESIPIFAWIAWLERRLEKHHEAESSAYLGES